MKKLICWFLLCSFIFSLLPATAFTTSANSETEPQAQIPFLFPSDYITTRFHASFEGGMPHYVDRTIRDSISGKVSPTTEVLENAFDGNTSSKYLTTFAADGSCLVEIKLAAATKVTTYLIASANDEPARDPAAWTLYGSANGSSWTVVDTENNVTFANRFEQKLFTVDSPATYQYYKLVVTKIKGSNPYVQYSELMLNPVDLSGGANEPDREENKLYGSLQGLTSLTTETVKDENDGVAALRMVAKHPKNVAASGYALLYKDVNLTVNQNTKLSYCIKPELNGAYDDNYSGHYAAVDLVFTDGTRLSQLNILDQNGHPVTPFEQGATRSLITQQWNYIEADLSALAGKTVDQILFGYDRNQNPTNGTLTAVTHLDALRLYDETPETIVSKTQYVKTTRASYFDNTNIFRGTAFPSVNLPNGMMKIAPATSAGSNIIYNYTADALTGFTVTHQSSIHLLDYDQFQFMPSTMLAASSANATNASGASRLAGFSHLNEIDRADYYGVLFDEGSAASGVKTEITATDHATAVRFTFPSDAANRTVIFDSLGVGVTATGNLSFGADGSFSATVKSGHDTLNKGYSTMYIYGRFSVAPTDTKVVQNERAIGAASFGAGTEVVVMQFAQSFISVAQAKKNLEMEIASATDFDETRKACTQAWEEIFALIDIEGATYTQLCNVYSGLYRMYSYPTNVSENTGTKETPKLQYMSPYTKTVKDGQMYTSNGFWDTYRTAWPAYTLLTPTKAGDLLDGVLQHYKDAGQMHRWLNPADVPSMLGTNSDAIFSDAAVKGVVFDHETAFETIVQNASTIEHATGSTRPNSLSLYTGYVHSGLGTSVSWEIENNISDYAASQFAQMLGKENYATYFRNRSLGYTYLFEPESGFFISRSANGTFTAVGDNLDPYLWDPNRYGHIESNAWNTAFSIAHDGEGLAALYGGKEAMAAKLDEMLTANTQCTTAIGTQHEMFEGRECKMGQYWHSNQPAHATLYMYNYTHQPYKTQRYTREVLDRLYVGGDFGQGYIGDEDNGEQSAWYLFSALGFYPLALGSGEYEITAPLFDKVTLHLESGDLTIAAHNNSAENVYIQSMTVDGVAHNATTITHEDLLGASTIEFTMGNTPSAWGTNDSEEATAPTPMVDLTGTSMATNKLFDNVANNASSLTVTDPVTVTFDQPKVVTMATVTCVDKTAGPKTVTVEASQSGADGSWVTLASVDPTYTFHFELMPISLNNTTAYKHYRLRFGGTCNVAEIELLGVGQLQQDSFDQWTDTSDPIYHLGVAGTDASDSFYEHYRYVAQEFVPTSPELYGAKIALNLTGGTATVHVEVRKEVNGNALLTKEIPIVSQGNAAHWYTLDFGEKLTLTPGEAYYLVYYLSQRDAGNVCIAHGSILGPYEASHPGYVWQMSLGGPMNFDAGQHHLVFGLELIAKDPTLPGQKETDVQAIIDAINAIGEITQNNYTEKEVLLAAAEQKLDALVTEYGEEVKTSVINLDKLTAAKATILALKEAADKAAAKAVEDQINALNVQSLDDEPAVIAARDAYNSLTDRQKGFVTNLAKLEEAEATIAQLKEVVPPVAILYGDVDGDGKVTAADALEVLKSVVGKTTLTDEQFKAADTDGNGKADAADALNILKKVVGKISQFPVEE